MGLEWPVTVEETFSAKKSQNQRQQLLYKKH